MSQIMSSSELNTSIITIKELFKIFCLNIPEYQRPYKWTEKNVYQLIDDIIENEEKSAYRIGTIVIHDNKKDGTLDIVDGQQRTITLFLLAYALYPKLESNSDLQNHVLYKGDNLSDYRPVSHFSFSNIITKQNVIKNYNAISRRIDDLTNEKFLRFFFNKCQFVKVVINDVSEAFQFFDSQNARGKDLEPHDLLKAYHLREMNHSSSEQEMKEVVNSWENMDTNELSDLFSQYLYRIKNWSKGLSARYFTKDDVEAFKGMSPNLEEDFPYTELYRIAHFYVDEFNASCHSKIHHKTFDFPFQIDQAIINGKRFFEYVTFYSKMVRKIKNTRSNGILKLINEYDNSNRTGDKYVRNLFYCALIFYVDKFGEKFLDRMIDKLFVWAYSLRLKLYSVGIDSVDNYALDLAHSQIQMFKLIRDANKPQDILNVQLENLTDIKATKEEKLVEKFEELKYYGTGK